MAYLGRQPAIGRYAKLDDFASSFNGSTTTFNLTSGGDPQVVQSEAQLIVSLGGIIQEPETDYTVSGSQISFTTAPISGDDFFAILFGDTFNIGAPSDNTIQNKHIRSDASIAMSKLDGSSGTLSALTVDNVILNGTTIGHTSDTDLLTLASGALTIAGTVNSTGNLGVNTASPAFTGSGGGIEVTNSTAAIVRAESSAGALQLKRDGSVGSLFDLSAGLALGASNSEVMRLLSGMILVGKTTTTITSNALQASLQIMGNAYNNSSISAMRWSANANGASINLGKSRHATVGSNTVVANGDELGKIDFSGDDGTDFQTLAGRISSVVAGTPGTGDIPADLVFSPGDGGSVSEALRITSASKVGIGVTVPDGLLHVHTGSAGDVNASADADELILESSGNAGMSLLAAASGNAQIYFGEGTDNDAAFIQYNGSIDDLIFSTTNAGSNMLFKAGAAATVLTLLSDTNASFANWLGIGVNPPARTLHAKGGTDTRTRTEESSGTLVDVTVLNTGHFLDSVGAVPLTINKHTGSQPLHFNTNNTNRMTIDSSGKVGIGITSPIANLEVTAGSRTFSGNHGMYANSRVGMSNHGSLTGLMLASTYNDANAPEYGLVFVQGPNTSSYNVWSLSPDGPAKGDSLNFIYGAQNTNIHATTPKVVFDGNGNVGIGTTSPGEALEVYRNAATTHARIKINNPHANAYSSELSLVTNSRSWLVGAGDNAIGIDNSGDFHIYDATASAYRLIIKSDGKVGIGTISPDANHKLEIASAGTTEIGIRSGNSSEAILNFGDTADRLRGRIAYNASSEYMTFWANAGEKIRIASAGQIGIGGANYGSSGQVLTSQGASAAPQWASAAGGGAWTLIGTALANNSASLTVTGLDNTYDAFAIVLADIDPGTEDAFLYFRVGDSSGIDSGANDYAWTAAKRAENTSSWSVANDNLDSEILINASLGVGEYINTIAYVYRGTTSTSRTGMHGQSVWLQMDGLLQAGMFGGFRQAAIDLTQVQIIFSTGDIDSGRMSVYGIKHT